MDLGLHKEIINLCSRLLLYEKTQFLLYILLEIFCPCKNLNLETSIKPHALITSIGPQGKSSILLCISYKFIELLI